MSTQDNLPRDSDGRLSRWAWPGGYPLLYLTRGCSVLCPSCASENENEDDPVTAADVNWEDALLHCDDCSGRIESAYAEDDAPDKQPEEA